MSASTTLPEIDLSPRRVVGAYPEAQSPFFSALTSTVRTFDHKVTKVDSLVSRMLCRPINHLSSCVCGMKDKLIPSGTLRNLGSNKRGNRVLCLLYVDSETRQ